MITIRHRKSKAILLEWEDTSLKGANLEKAKLAEANLHGQFMPRADLSGADLRGADLSVASLTRINLSQSMAEKALFRRAQMDHADARNARLSGAELRYADLEHACFDHADLQHARIGGGRDTSFANADLREARLTGWFSNCVFNEADLRGARLKTSSLGGCSFQGADLRGVDLRGKDLENASFEEADLRGTRLDGLPIRWRDSLSMNVIYLYLLSRITDNLWPNSQLALVLSNRYFVWTLLVVLVFAGILLSLPVSPNFKGAKWRGARYDSSTRWPLGFRPEVHGAILVGDGSSPRSSES